MDRGDEQPPDVLGQGSDDEVSKSSHFWVINKSLLESILVGWHYAGMVDSNIQWEVRAWPGTESRECVWYDHFLTCAGTDCEVISLQMNHHALESCRHVY